MPRALYLLVAVAVAALLGGCDDISGSVRSIAIEPAETSLPAGVQSSWAAVATRYDGTTFDVTGQVAWTSSKPDVATVDAEGRVRGVTAGEAFITIAVDNIVASQLVTITPPEVSRLIVAASVRLPVGVRQQLVLLAEFTDGSTGDVTARATFASSDPALVEVAPTGVVHALATGMADVTVTVDGVNGPLTRVVAVEVTDAVIASIELDPTTDTLPKGLTRQLAAIGHFTDGTTLDLTTQVTWASSQPVFATVDATGFVVAKQRGVTTISAQLGVGYGKIDLQVTGPVVSSLVIDGSNLTVPKGYSERLVAYGHMSDGSVLDLTTSVSWSSSVPGTATVGDSPGSHGLVQGVTAGSTVISISNGPLMATTTLRVTDATLVSLSIGVGNATLPLGYGEDLVAIGTFDDASTEDLTTQVTWSSNNGRVSVTSAGRAVGEMLGTSTVTAARDAISDTQDFGVANISIVSATITAPSPTAIALGTFEQLIATGRFSDNLDYPISDDVIWTSSNTIVANITNRVGVRGIVEPFTEGFTSISAIAPGSQVFDQITVEITPPN